MAVWPQALGQGWRLLIESRSVEGISLAHSIPSVQAPEWFGEVFHGLHRASWAFQERGQAILLAWTVTWGRCVAMASRSHQSGSEVLQDYRS